MNELFLICALTLPSPHFTWPRLVSWQATESDEEERLIAWIRKNNPGAEVFIHPDPQEELLKDNHWEKLPFTHRGNKIWIKRKAGDQKMLGASA